MSSVSENRPALELYPPIEPYNTGFLRVSDLHEIYYEESGARDGKPVLYV
jgi:proline iminopeptidase